MEPKETTVARKRLGKRASAATDTHATTEELLETVFSMRSVPRLYTWGGQESRGTRNQKRLCWWGPAEIYPTDS
jgi:hypothetical protein